MTISSRSALVAAIATAAAACPGAALAMPADGGRSAVSPIQDLRSADTRAPLADQLRGHSVAQQIRAREGRDTAYRALSTHRTTTATPQDSGEGGEPWVAIGAGLVGAGLCAGSLALVERRRPRRRHAAI
jgi:hypothetical protein